MTLLEYFSNFSSIWKIIIFIILFCAWPLSAYLIFHYHINIFARLDILKLSLLASAMTSPFLVINSGLTLLLLYPGNAEFRKQRENLQVIPATAFIAVTFTAIVLSIGSLLAFLDINVNSVIITMASIEGSFIMVSIYSAIRERA